jgi:dienelactone hydrolase
MPSVLRIPLMVALLLMATTSLPLQAQIVSKTLPYTAAGTEMAGYLTYDDRLTGPRPGVLVFHEWWGLNSFAKHQADALAAKGYIVLAADMYGQGINTHDSEEANSLASAVRDRALFRSRAEGALEALMHQHGVDSNRIAAVGYCFGGTTVLELAYSGAPVRGVVSVHGGLTAPKPEDLSNIQSAVLVLHGAADPFTKPEEMQAFQQGMEAAGADWQMVIFGGAQHGFSNPESSQLGMEGVAYDAKTAERAWQAMNDFLARVLGSSRQ